MLETRINILILVLITVYRDIIFDLEETKYPPVLSIADRRKLRKAENPL